MSDARTRTERSEAVKAERRRRNDTTIDGSQRLKLAIPLEVEARLKAEGRVPRWINDQGNRLVNLTKYDDYDPVEGVEPVHVGWDKESNKPIKAILHSKPAAFIEEDRRKADEPRRELERALVRGKVPGDTHGHDERYSSGYVDEATKIHHGGGLGPP